MPSWIILAAIVAMGLVAYGVARARIAVQKQAGRDAERAERAKQDLAAAQTRATEARKSGDVRHEIDRSDFGDAVDRL